MTPIISRPSNGVTISQLHTAMDNLPASLLFRMEMLNPLWNAAMDYGIDPVGMIAQSAHETGWGTFPRMVKPQFRNTCGVKTSQAVRNLYPEIQAEQPLAHAAFPSWDVGAKAHAQHLWAYCQRMLSSRDVLVDPRYELVMAINHESGRPPAIHFGDLDYWSGFGGYGVKMEEKITQILMAVDW